MRAGHAPPFSGASHLAPLDANGHEPCRAFPADIALFLVDNNACRLAGARFARRRGIPAVFAMLSANAMRTHVFLQGAAARSACIHCALPNLDPEGAMPCVPAMITSCLLAAAYTTFFVHRALMGRPAGVEPFNWRESDLLASRLI